MRIGSGSASVESGHVETGTTVSFDTGIVPKSLTVRMQEPVFSVRMTPDCRGRLSPLRLNLLNTSAGGVCKYELRINAALTGATWSAGDSVTYDQDPGAQGRSLAEQGSRMQVDTAASAVRGGTTVISGYLIDAEVRDLLVDFSDFSQIDGTTDTLTLVATFMQGSVDLSASIQLREF